MSIEVERAMKRRADALKRMKKTPVAWENYDEVIQASEPWDPITEPQNFDWSLITQVPLSHFKEISVNEIEDVEDPAERREHKERYKTIKDMLKLGRTPWPVIVASNGMVIDGFHRIAAMRDLGWKYADVLYVEV